MSYTRDWITASYLDPWKNSLGNDWLLDSGLKFNDEKTFIYKSMGVTVGNINSIGSCIFHVDELAGVQSTLGYCPMDNGSNEYLMARLSSETDGTNLNLGFTWRKVNGITGQESSVGATGSNIYGLVSDSNGTLTTQYISPTGTEIYGTWQLSCSYDGSSLGSVDVSGSDWTPVTGSYYLNGHYGYNSNPSIIPLVLYTGSYAYDWTASGLEKYFWYDGHYSNGSQTGEYNLTTALISISPIQQYLYLPGIDGAFSSAVTVTLKNDENQWGTFTGHSLTGTSYNPSGVFYIRDADVESGHETLFAGFLEYKSIKLDALNQTVSFTLNSVLDGLLEKPLCPVSHITEANAAEQSFYGVVRPQIVGSISNIDRDYGSESGTISLTNTFPLKKGELLTNTSSGEELFKAGQILEDSGGSSSFIVEKIPFWLNTGDTLLRNKAYPDDIASASINGYDFFNDFLRLPLSLYNANGNDSWGGADLSWDITDSNGTNSLRAALESIIISPSQYIYGDETFIDVLNELLKSVGGGGCAAYNGETVNLFVPSPIVALQASAGSLNYSTDVLGGFTASKDSPLKSLYIQYAYSEEERKYLENTTVDTDFDYGDEKKIATWLINFNEDARNLGFLVSTYFSSGATHSFETRASNWDTLAPGKAIDLSNIPTVFESSGTKHLNIFRAWNPSTKIVTAVVQEITLETYEYFKVGVHDIGGSVGVL